MEELSKEIQLACNIDELTSKKAIETMRMYLGKSLPESFQKVIDHLLSGGSFSQGIKDNLVATSKDFQKMDDEIFGDFRKRSEEIKLDAQIKITDFLKKRRIES